MQRPVAAWRRALFCGLAMMTVSAGCGATTPPSSAATARAAGSGERHALLIGINRYRINEAAHSAQQEGPRFPDLNGAVNDIELIGEILAERYGLAEDRIVRITDGAATRDRILTELRRLTERTVPGDAIYIHFSGHGSQVRDFDGNEDDGFDETILPHDARTGEIRDITDDELGRAMSALAGRDVLLVLDSCHSGTATRGVTVLSRSVGPDPREELYRRAAAEQPKTREVVEAELGYTLMTGAAEHESALDGPIGGRYYGFFSYLLAKAMERVPADASAREIHEEVLTGYSRFARRLRQFTMPQPQLEAAADRIDRQVLTVAERAETEPTKAPTAATPSPRARLAFATVVETNGSGRDTHVVLDAAGFDAAGFDSGDGSLWAIYSPGELAFRPGNALAIGEVSGESEDRALLRILRPVGYRPSIDSRAIPLSSGDASQTRVQFDDLPAAIATGLRTRLREIPNAVEANEGQLAQFVVVGNGDRIEIRGLGGLKTLSSISAANAETAVHHVARVIRHAGTVGALLSLENRASALDLDVAVGASLRGAGSETVYNVRADGQPRTEANSLFVEIEAGAAGYLTIANVDAEGQVQVLFPNPISEDRGFLPGGAVAGGQTVRIPDSLEPTNRAGFHWDVAPPAGLDTLQVFLSTDRETADQIRNFIDAMNGETASMDELARSLATRGLKIVANAPATSATQPAPQGAPTSSAGDWTSRTVSFVVQGDQP